MYEEAVMGWADVVEEKGQWVVYVRVIFAEGPPHEGRIFTFFHKAKAELAARIITVVMNRTDIRARGIIDY